MTRMALPPPRRGIENQYPKIPANRKTTFRALGLIIIFPLPLAPGRRRHRGRRSWDTIYKTNNYILGCIISGPSPWSPRRINMLAHGTASRLQSPPIVQSLGPEEEKGDRGKVRQTGGEGEDFWGSMGSGFSSSRQGSWLRGLTSDAQWGPHGGYVNGIDMETQCGRGNREWEGKSNRTGKKKKKKKTSWWSENLKFLLIFAMNGEQIVP